MDSEQLEVQLAAALMHEEHGYVDTTSDTYHRCKWRVRVIRSALEAAGMRVVPMREPVMCSACGSHVGCDCTRMRTGTANWMTIDAALLAAQEDSTSE